MACKVKGKNSKNKPESIKYNLKSIINCIPKGKERKIYQTINIQ